MSDNAPPRQPKKPSGGPRRGTVIASYLARAGFGSRRSCAELVTAGRVRVNGQVVTDLATRVMPEQDEVRCGRHTVHRQQLRYVVLNKPVGYTCTAADDHARSLAIELIKAPWPERIFNVGRLDRDSEGLLLFTNDGELANRLMHPRYRVEKTYRVHATGVVDDEALSLLTRGITDGGDRLRAISARAIERRGDHVQLEIVVAEGRKREVRRMCRRIECTVTRLIRTAFGPLHLARLPEGHWRELTAAEVARLREVAGLAQAGTDRA